MREDQFSLIVEDFTTSLVYIILYGNDQNDQSIEWSLLNLVLWNQSLITSFTLLAGQIETVGENK